MKYVLINKCDECPHAIFDMQDKPEYWGKWYCCNDDLDGFGAPMLLVSLEIPQWCPLKDYRKKIK